MRALPWHRLSRSEARYNPLWINNPSFQRGRYFYQKDREKKYNPQCKVTRDTA
jgi:hypothetical protein